VHRPFIAAASTSTANASSRSATTDGASTRSHTAFDSLTVTIIAPRLGNQTRERLATTPANSYTKANKALLSAGRRGQLTARRRGLLVGAFGGRLLTGGPARLNVVERDRGQIGDHNADDYHRPGTRAGFGGQQRCD
jgi:hypothetical protein